jgi:DNA repair photolyase
MDSPPPPPPPPPPQGKATNSLLQKGRGSASNDESRYLKLRTEVVDDGWYTEQEPISRRTQVLADRTVKIITKNQSPDISFSQSINPYKGCEHGCIYCFARPTHAYLDLSPGLDFETKLFYKTDVRAHLLDELGKRGYICSTLAIGTNTDPYQPLEKEKRIMREILQTLLELRHPVGIVTKSSLVLRDLDILSEMAQLGLAHVYLSVTTLDNSLKTKLEPRTAGPAARLRTISALREAGIPAGAMIAPVIPFINDHELENLVARCVGAGAQAVSYILIRLPLEVRPLFEQWLQDHYPLKAGRVMAAIRDTRGGRAYRGQWHKRMVGQGPIAELIAKRFSVALKRAELTAGKLKPLRTDLFTPPVRNKRGPQDPQLNLF